MSEEQTFEVGDKIQYCSGNPNVLHPIGTVVKLMTRIKNHHQKILVQYGNDKPRLVYANDYRIIEKVKHETL